MPWRLPGLAQMWGQQQRSPFFGMGMGGQRASDQYGMGGQGYSLPQQLNFRDGGYTPAPGSYSVLGMGGMGGGGRFSMGMPGYADPNYASQRLGNVPNPLTTSMGGQVGSMFRPSLGNGQFTGMGGQNVPIPAYSYGR